MQKLAFYISSAHMFSKGDWLACIDEAADMGFTGVELFGGEGDVDFLSMAEPRLEEIARRSGERGVRLSLHPWVDWRAFSEDDLRKRYLSLLDRCVRAGIGEVNMHMGFLAARRAGMRRVLDVTAECLPVLERYGITLYYENVADHGIRELGSELWDFEALFSRFPPESGVMLNIDSGHAHIMHQIDSLAEAFASRWKYTHINDNAGLLDQHLAPGDGTLDFAHFAQKAAEADYAGPLMMEYHQRGLPGAMDALYAAYEGAGYTADRLKL